MRAALLAAALAACAHSPTRSPRSLVELRSKGTVLQTHEYSCGAAALATLMGRFGKTATEAEVLDGIFGGKLPMEAGPQGRPRLRALSLADLEAGARGAGFKVVSTQVPDRKSFPEVLRALGPGIARMRLYGEIPHFVLLDELRDGWVKVADPGYGNFWLPAGKLFDAWDAGDRVFLTISKRPFYAWKEGDDKPVYLKRHDAETRPPGEAPAPPELERTLQRRQGRMGSLP
ncbi:MAG: hypothetical protein HYZ75_07230 [Elusimicrobia bacterium]|nr:hypothetical protein [Elusimicrobiota bacterium]